MRFFDIHCVAKHQKKLKGTLWGKNFNPESFKKSHSSEKKWGILSVISRLWTSVLFLGVGKNFRLLMQSCCFFFSRPFHENFKFLKNCSYDFHEILHSHSTPKGAPACAKASKSYGWDVRNIAKISPKMAKKQPFFEFFRFSQKLSIRFERNFLQLFYTILESYMCNGFKIVWLGCEKHSQN